MAQTTSFSAVVESLLTDLQVATPKIKKFYAATVKTVTDGNATLYGVAQCAETVSQAECQNCMNVAYGNIQSCPPRAEGIAVDAGCFMRYSDTAFFATNQTINIKRYLSNGETHMFISIPAHVYF